ncbi:hypothetical protein TRVL_10393 [Trypanosoma vivax]|nr:hypothetical protein TRVL_10393 [Trypanosoma vivax]
MPPRKRKETRLWRPIPRPHRSTCSTAWPCGCPPRCNKLATLHAATRPPHSKRRSGAFMTRAQSLTSPHYGASKCRPHTQSPRRGAAGSVWPGVRRAHSACAALATCPAAH